MQQALTFSAEGHEHRIHRIPHARSKIDVQLELLGLMWLQQETSRLVC